jgi:hypothetical protein
MGERASVNVQNASLVVAGRAVQFHGHRRPAKDLDLVVEPSAENWPKLQAALRPLNASVPAFEELSQGRRYQAKLRFYETVEFLTAIDDVGFAEAWAESIEIVFASLHIRVLSKAHLILSKQYSRRQVDVDDLRALEGIPGTDKDNAR